MAAEKKQPISQTRHIQFAVTGQNREMLSWFEAKIMREKKCKDCLEIPNADIINYAIEKAYWFLNKKDKGND